MVAPIWRPSLSGGNLLREATRRAGRGDRPHGSRRARESSPDLAVERDPGAPPSGPSSTLLPGKRTRGGAGKPAPSRRGESSGGDATHVGCGPEGSHEFPEGPARRSDGSPGAGRRSRPSRPQRRRQGDPETAGGQRPGNGYGRSAGTSPGGEPHGRRRSPDRQRPQGASRRGGRNHEAGRCRARQTRVNRTCGRGVVVGGETSWEEPALGPAGVIGRKP